MCSRSIYGFLHIAAWFEIKQTMRLYACKKEAGSLRKKDWVLLLLKKISVMVIKTEQFVLLIQ